MTRRAVAAAVALAACLPLATGCGEDGSEEQPAAALASTATAPAPVRPAVGRPPGFPNGGERFLLERLDPALARRCTRAPAGLLSDAAVAGLVCRPAAEGGAAARFELFPARASLAAAYGGIRTANGVPVASGQCVPPGGGGGVPADGPWGFGRGRDEGRVQCYRTGDGVRFVTSVERIRTLAIATAPTFAGALRFWRGPGIPSLRPLR